MYFSTKRAIPEHLVDLCLFENYKKEDLSKKPLHEV
jgi:hypothetical protein